VFEIKFPTHNFSQIYTCCLAIFPALESDFRFVLNQKMMMCGAHLSTAKPPRAVPLFAGLGDVLPSPPLSEAARMSFFSGARRRASLRSSSGCKSPRPHRSRAASPEPRCRSVVFTVISSVLAGATITIEIEAEPAAPLFIESSEPPRASLSRSSFPVGEPRRSPLVKRHHSPRLVQRHCS
jgi:hypothetical protein